MKAIKNSNYLLLLFSLFGLLGGVSAQNAENTTMAVVRTANDPQLQWGPCPTFMPEGCEIAVLHGDPSMSNADVFFKVPANTDIPDHWHHSAERMVLISGEMLVSYKGEATQTLTAGTYAYGPPEKPHTARCADAGPCILFIAFEGPVDAIETAKKY